MSDFVLVDDVSVEETVDAVLLDLLFSTSQTFFPKLEGVSPKLRGEIEFEFEQSRLVQKRHCQNHAPTIFYVDAVGKARLVEGCCNSWECGRCGQIRARHEFTRIVSGASDLDEQGHKLYFWTFTCRGRELLVGDAEKNYQMWCNRLLTAARAKATRVTKKHPAEYWCYSGVTERQKRGHPHTHMLTTFVPSDAFLVKRGARNPEGRLMKHDTLYSAWFKKEAVKAGLGNECEITEVRSVIGAASYVSKYMFKDAISQKWPKGWRRVRYSQNFPKLPVTKNVTAIPLIKHNDWLKVEHLAPIVYADSEMTYERALAHGVYNVIPPR